MDASEDNLEAARFPDTAEHITQTERRAAAAERDAVDRYLAAWMADRVGDMFDVRISDRQGKLVYYTGNYLNDWKAVDNSGTDLPPGIYFYYMKNRFNGEEFRGYIQVIR
jgi:hypothetical protein